MPPRLARVTAEQTLHALKQLGFEQVRQRGSHIVLQKKTSEGTVGCVVPYRRDLNTNWNAEKYSKTSRNFVRGVYGEFVADSCSNMTLDGMLVSMTDVVFTPQSEVYSWQNQPPRRSPLMKSPLQKKLLA